MWEVLKVFDVFLRTKGNPYFPHFLYRNSWDNLQLTRVFTFEGIRVSDVWTNSSYADLFENISPCVYLIFYFLSLHGHCSDIFSKARCTDRNIIAAVCWKLARLAVSIDTLTQTNLKFDGFPLSIECPGVGVASSLLSSGSSLKHLLSTSAEKVFRFQHKGSTDECLWVNIIGVHLVTYNRTNLFFIVHLNQSDL